MEINVFYYLQPPQSNAVAQSVFCRSQLARSASSRPLRPVTMQPRQSAWHWRANRRAPGMPADGRAVRTGCENGTPCYSHTHIHTHTELSTVALCANSQAGSTPTLLADRLIIVTRVVAVGRRCSLVSRLFCRWIQCRMTECLVFFFVFFFSGGTHKFEEKLEKKKCLTSLPTQITQFPSEPVNKRSVTIFRSVTVAPPVGAHSAKLRNLETSF